MLAFPLLHHHVSRTGFARPSLLRVHPRSTGRRPRTTIVLCSTPISRRNVVHLLIVSGALSLMRVHPGSANPLRPNGPDLRERLAKKIPARPRNLLTAPDIVYPDFCAGSWKVSSTLAAVTAPAGYRLFGRTGALEEAIEGIGEAVEYEARFVRSPLGVVADRAFNVSSIAESTMGRGCVLDCHTDVRNAGALTASLRPSGADGAVFVVSMRSLFREQHYAIRPTRIGLDDEKEFRDLLASDAEGEVMYASEMVRQTVEPGVKDIRMRPMVKDVETTVVVFSGDGKGFDVVQRTATYLTNADMRYVDTKGRPVDLRWYRVRYTAKGGNRDI